MRLINADALKANVPNTNVDIFEDCRNCTTLCDWQVKELIDKMPTIDAVEVVRCKECKCLRFYEDGTWWCEQTEREIINPNWFCADGERRDPCSSQDS